MTLPTPIGLHLAARAKWAFTTRRCVRRDAVRLIETVAGAIAGDLVLGRVEQIGRQKTLQLGSGRSSELYPGDLVVTACGARYAADQFEGLAELDPAGSDLLAGGGVIGRMRARHDSMSPPTCIVPLGLLGDRDGSVLNVARYRLPSAPRPEGLTAIGVVGAAMNSGKTTATASLVHGLARAGRRVAAIKATGTGAFGDINAYRDAGAHVALDFTDAGMASTYRESTERLAEVLDSLLAAAGRAACDVAVIEIADGVLQTETAALLADASVRRTFAGFAYAAPDPLSAVGGVAELARFGIVPEFLTGLIARSPLATAEAEAATGFRVLGREALRDPAEAIALLHRLTRRFEAVA